MALHVSRSARGRLGLKDASPGGGGKLALPTLTAARELSDRVRRAAAGESDVGAGELYALSRLEEVFQLVISRHLRERDPAALEGFLYRAQTSLGVEETERVLAVFGADYELPGSRDVLLREFLTWWAIDDNPAASPVTSIFFDGPFRGDAGVATLRRALQRPGPAAAPGDDLLDRLRAPARAAPDSAAGQLRFVIEHWGDLLGVDWDGLLRGLDLLAEEQKRFVFGPGPGPTETPAFSSLDDEPERFSTDQDWMAAVVLLAKNAFVWLDQLSARLDRPIRRLDEIPDEVLAEIAAQGFTGLWLIGLWERSAASARLKQLMGRPDALASAYSLRSYRVAAALGGEAALEALGRRARGHGIRLGADMVPNHFGLDSDWLLAHPDRFLSVADSPFAVYRFDGPDLSPDPAVRIQIEDHYYDHSDAAVVFRREDRRTGDVRFVYHGNDGTSTPWNDTAQLDYLNAETREAVIETILDVARRFPLIRFDAAMTLTRRHYQRLWFPAAGSGGAVPSRAEHGMDRERFAERMPEEFWRQVVERVEREAPGTLLLAEAFWLMEGYFVRSLGMHRVYNSAFMNMLRDGENAKYRRLIKETLAFDPRILRRYVNFLTNPDERTAIDQFGDGDRYFGACVLLATLPGLPMFGHGQIEGYREKYGMEFRRPDFDESANPELVARHEREIVPLLRRRDSFAGVEHFELYDLVDPSGAVDENVLAYSNGAGADRTLVVFNNSAAPVIGSLRRSAPHANRPSRPLAEALELTGGRDDFWVFRDHVSGRTHLRSSDDLGTVGLQTELAPFRYRVLEGFRRVDGDADERYRRLAARIDPDGVEDLDRALADLDLEPVWSGLVEVFRRPLLTRLGQPEADVGFRAEIAELLVSITRPLAEGSAVEDEPEQLSRGLASILRAAGDLTRLADEPGLPGTSRFEGLVGDLTGWLEAGPEVRLGVVAIALLERLGESLRSDGDPFGRLPLETLLGPVMDGLGSDPERVSRALEIVRAVWRRGWSRPGPPLGAAEVRQLPRRWAADPSIAPLVGSNRTAEGLWVRREDFEELADWRVACGLVAALATAETRADRAEAIGAWLEARDRLRGRALAAGYRVDEDGGGVGEPADALPSEPEVSTVSE